MLELATKTVFAGAGRRITVPLLTDGTIGGPLGGTWVARNGGSAAGDAGIAVARSCGLTMTGPCGPTIIGPAGGATGGGTSGGTGSCASPRDGINSASAAIATIGNL